MRVNRWIAGALAAALATNGCAVTKAPRGWLDTPEKSRANAYGAWIETTCNRGPRQAVSISGELIAVGPDSLYIARDRIVAVDRGSIEKAKLVAYDASVGGLVVFTVIGTLASVSHGWALIFSAPIWIIAGSIAAGVRSHEPIQTYPGFSLDSFAPYARFPNGLPATVDRSAIRAKSL